MKTRTYKAMWFPRLILVISCMEAMHAARILGVFPVPSISHQVVFRTLVHELARRGHELVVLTTDPARLHPNITEIDAHDVSYTLWNNLFFKYIVEDERAGRRSLLNQYATFMKLLVPLFEAQVSLPEVQRLIKSKTEKFDLILVESMVRTSFVFRHLFKAPLIAVSSLAGMQYTYEAVGIPTHPILYPDVMGRQTSNLNLYQKIDAIMNYLYKSYYDALALKRTNEAVRKIFGEDTPDIADLEAQTDMLFLNVNPIWDGVKPTPPNVFYMWGAHLQPSKEIPSDLKTYLDDSTRGVVYMSLGSNVKSSELSADKLSVFVEAFRHLPYDVLWKWETEELPGRPDNVRIAKWLPQADLLKHPNIKAFITQGGQQSTDEAIQAGVPLVGIPFIGDQEANVERYELHGVGVALNIKTLTADELEVAVKSVAQEQKYRAAVRRMSRLLADEGVAGGVERAAWWVEYVLRHGGAQHLRSPAAGVSAAQYFVLDVVATLSLAAVAFLILFATAVYYIYSKSKSLRWAHKRKAQ